MAARQHLCILWTHGAKCLPWELGSDIMCAAVTTAKLTTPACLFTLSFNTHRLGLPTSSSQCITGGIVGVGLCEGFTRGVNWRLFGKQFLSWVSTLFVVGLGVAAIFAQVGLGWCGASCSCLKFPADAAA